MCQTLSIHQGMKCNVLGAQGMYTIMVMVRIARIRAAFDDGSHFTRKFGHPGPPNGGPQAGAAGSTDSDSGFKPGALNLN
jgi:hypothetical protein